MNANISEFAKNLLKDSEEAKDVGSELPKDSEMQAYLDGKKTTSTPKRKKRKMPGYRRVTQTFTGLFSFDEYLEFSDAYYSPTRVSINKLYYSRRLLEKVTKVTQVTNKVTRGYVTVTSEQPEVTGISIYTK